MLSLTLSYTSWCGMLCNGFMQHHFHVGVSLIYEFHIHVIEECCIQQCSKIPFAQIKVFLYKQECLELLEHLTILPGMCSSLRVAPRYWLEFSNPGPRETLGITRPIS